MKTLVLTIAVLCAGFVALGQSTNPPTFIKGTLDIKFNTKSQVDSSGQPLHGVKNVYTVNVNVANSAVFHGTISDQPQLIEGIFNKTVVQPRQLDYEVATDVVNPKNTSQTKNVGHLYGTVPISSDGVYHYDSGSITTDVLPIGSAPGFSSKFRGTVNGKPMNRPSNWLDTFKGSTVSITRMVNGKPMTVTLKKYDRMVYNQAELGGGPAQIYTPIVVAGEMLYDYDKNCWFFNNFSLAYAGHYDRITGTIRWVESPQHRSNGEGEYQFDVRVNEPPPAENAAFAASTDESAFFESDSSVPSLTGTMKYKDTLRGPDTMASNVTIDLASNNLNKQQVMALAKVIIFSAVVPMNSD